MSNQLQSSEAVKRRAVELGFNLVGIARAEPSPTLSAYERWIASGMHAEMGYMARPDRAARRRDLNRILPGVRSMIIVGVDYRTALPDASLHDPSRGRIASYAWGVDYHALITPRLELFASWLAEKSGITIAHRAYVDTGAILERSHAQTAGLGFIGKNTMLIHPRRGSFFFLGEILTDLVFDHYDTPLDKATMCGNCTRCLRACPTDAFPQPHVLDARRCISYWTIEHKGWIDRALRPLMGNWIFGCDVCQEVCPFQRFAPITGESAFTAHNLDRAAPLLLDLLRMDEAAFSAQFGGTPIARIKRDSLVRNACVAAGNWGDQAAIPALTMLLDDPAPLVRGHAAWALARISGAIAAPLLYHMIDREPDADVRGEIAAALTM